MASQQIRNDDMKQDGKRLGEIYFYLTRGCNQRCRHCWIGPRFEGTEGQHRSLDLALFISIVEQAKQ
jgi:MoaA/NifB/PqqE/SkfB family radical SAM enzyme